MTNEVFACWSYSHKLARCHNHVSNILIFIDAWAIFLLPQEKRNVFINNKLAYTSCLTSCRTTQDLGNKEISEKWQSFMELFSSAHTSPQKENFVCTSKNLQKNRNWTYPVVRYVKWKLEFAPNILLMIAGLLALTLVIVDK